MLQWAVGLFCALIGALMITVPEQFDTPAYAAFVPHLTGWGLAFLVAGNGLLAVAIFSPRRTLTIVGHLLAAGVVLALARGFTVPGIWTATCQYAVLGLGTAIAPFIRGPGGPEEWRGGRHLFGLLMGLGAMASGLMFWGFPRQFLAPFYDVVRPHLALYGLIFVGGGGALVFAQLPQLPRWATRVLYPVGGGALLVSLATTALPARYWTGIVYGGAFGLLLVLQPWMGPLLYAIRPSSLRARIALALAVAAAVPLIFAVGFVTGEEERSATQQALVLQQTLAKSLADQISDFVVQHRAAAVTLADSLSLSGLDHGGEEALLRAVAGESPDIVAFSSYDAAGQPRARSDGRPLHAANGLHVFEAARETNGLSVDFYVSPTIHQLVMGFAAPTRSSDGQFSGAVLGTVEASSIDDILRRVSTDIAGASYLVDEAGRVIASGDATRYPLHTDLSGAPPVTEMLLGSHLPGSLIYRGAEGVRVVGYARLDDVTWGVVVERPRAAALAGADRVRERAFQVHLLLIGLAALAGIVLASAIAKPLEGLAREVTRFDEGTSHDPVPHSAVAEVRELSTAFEEMRTRLAARTAERARAEGERVEALGRERRLSNHVRLLLESVTEGVYGIDMQGCCTFINQTAANVLGYAPDELIGRDMHAVLHHSLADGSPYPVEACPILRALRTGHACRIDSEVFWRRDGTSFPVEFSSGPIVGEHGLEGAVVAFEDITARRRNEAALQASEERIRLIIETAQDAFVATDPDGLITAWNAQAEATFGWPRSEAVGRRLSDTIIPPQARDTHEGRLKQVLAAGGVAVFDRRFETTALHRDGHEFPVEFSVSPVRAGDAFSFNIFVHDISERKQTELALREREARISAIMDSTSDGILFVGLNGRIQTANRRAGVLLAQPLGSTAKGDLRDLLASVGVELAECETVLDTIKALREGRSVSGEGDLELSVTKRVLHWEMQPTWGAGGTIAGYTLTLHDMTEEREVSRMKSDFVSFVTHQLRTPLSGIKWMLELAAETEAAEDLRQYIDDARAANQRLIHLVNDLLDVSRLESGRLTLTSQELDLTELTKSVLAELAPIIHEKGHRLTVAPAETPPPVQADPQLMRQVVMNLLSNAIKYTPGPGDIILRVGQENGGVTWAVQDSGIGIPQASMSKLFEKFYRADNVAILETEGTGLGLYLVRLIVERHGGRIWCESEEGKGSTFHFMLPFPRGH